MKIINVNGDETVIKTQMDRTEVTFLQKTHSSIKEVSQGCILIVLQAETTETMSKLKKFIETEEISLLLTQLLDTKSIRERLKGGNLDIEIQIKARFVPTSSKSK